MSATFQYVQEVLHFVYVPALESRGEGEINWWTAYVFYSIVLLQAVNGLLIFRLYHALVAENLEEFYLSGLHCAASCAGKTGNYNRKLKRVSRERQN